MYRIGEFSELSKTTIKTLRYYEKERLLIPAYVDEETGYRFYETSQFPELAKIISLRQIGLSINNIKSILNGSELEQILKLRKQELETEISLSSSQLLQINNLLEGKSMEHEVIIKELQSYTIYYKEGVVKDFSEIVQYETIKAEPIRERYIDGMWNKGSEDEWLTEIQRANYSSESNEECWNDWIKCDNEYSKNDKKAIEAGACKYLNFIAIVLKKK